MQDNAVLIFAKAPYAGQVKTRLVPAIGERAATKLYSQLLEREIAWIANETPYDIELWVSPDTTHPLLQSLAKRHSLSLFVQQGEDLGERMGYAVRQSLKRYRRIVLLGVDCPALTANHLQQTFDWLTAGEDAVIGPAEDGGYVLLGLNAWDDSLFHGHEWGKETVAETTRQALSKIGWRWRELPTLWDLDRPSDLQQLKSLNIAVPVYGIL
ncbi:MAG: TIGR04282 family arsenosugar biosynthesis glycosyltransferase [Candidatus Thiodiazotropha sp. (ex Myrtea sp. 'scaly one' KF741663)]|nr:TIGR04282 family arsenosugar biosynthesis glycosyltransferase [Candidatus Thiodiazotropha sp. (ex Myrtea sp. 'scaly one' KF741663)]